MYLTPEIKELFTLNERGHTLICSEEGNVTLWAEIESGVFFIVDWRSENYPAMETGFCHLPKSDLVRRIQEDFCGWFIRKNALEIPEDGDGCVAELEEVVV